MKQQALPVVPDVLVIDTCVLISSVLRPLLLRMAAAGFFVPVWSPTIGEEWRRTAQRLWKTSAADIAQQWRQLQDDFPEADIGDISGYGAELQKSDPKDWHVIAAGQAAMSRYTDSTVAIVTRNIKDFHRAELRRLGLHLFDPDQLISRFWSHDSHRVRAHLTMLPDHIGSPAHEQSATLEFLLKRERLFRLNRLLQGYS